MQVIKKRSNSETGHFKNLMNLEDLIARLTALGERYNPSRSELQIAHLQSLHQEAQQMMEKLTTALSLNNVATNVRAELFELLPPLATRIVNHLIASGVSAKTLEDARGFQRKIQGSRLNKKETEANTASNEPTGEETSTPETENGEMKTDKARSASQQSYDLKIDHLAKLLSLVQNEALYQPNEPELQIATLQNYLQQLRNANTQKTYADAELEVARRERNRVFYHRENGFVARALQAKAYAKSALGAKSEDFKHIQRIKFRMMD